MLSCLTWTCWWLRAGARGGEHGAGSWRRRGGRGRRARRHTPTSVLSPWAGHSPSHRPCSCSSRGTAGRLQGRSPWALPAGLGSRGEERGWGGDPQGARAHPQLAQVEPGVPPPVSWERPRGRRCGVKQEGAGEASGEEGAASAGRSAVLGSEGVGSKGGGVESTVSPRGDSQELLREPVW